MKKITLVIILSMLSLSMSVSQTKYGVGFEFHTMPSALLASQGATQSLGVYLPINTATLLIEPLVMYNSSTQEIEYDNFSYDDYEYSESDLTLLIGILKPTVRGKIRSYYGVRFGKEWYEEDYDNNDSDVEMEYLIIAPTIGAEYYISDNFSFGGEGMFTMLTREDNEDNYKMTSKENMLIPRFIVRFYF